MITAHPGGDDHTATPARFHVTVATIIERDGHFLLVEEDTAQGRRFNQPAGHLELGESLPAGARREVLEETGWEVDIQGIVGLGLYTSPDNGVTYHRTTFYGQPLHHYPERELDDGIIAAHWLHLGEIRQHSARMRSPLVLKTIEQYLEGHRYPLSLLHDIPSGSESIDKAGIR